MAGSLLSSEEASLVKHVQELATNGNEPPMRYVRREQDDAPVVDASLSSSIPIIDLQHLSSPFVSSEEREEEMEKLKSALTTWGLFQAIGHDIPDSLLDEVRRFAKEFFDLPMEEKHKYSIHKDGTQDFLQGYGNDLIVSEEQVLDWSDRLYLLVRPHDQRKLNLWPDYPNRFREMLNEYNTKTNSVAELILKAMARLVGLEETYFLNQVGERGPTFVRFNYFPPCPKPDLVFGLKRHTGGGAITIVLQDDEVEGLQVQKDGHWIKVPIVPHSLLINVADQVEIMSNGVFKSPTHRVTINSEKQRISVATFYLPEEDKDIKPAAALISETRPRLFKKIKSKEYGEMFFQKAVRGKREQSTGSEFNLVIHLSLWIVVQLI